MLIPAASHCLCTQICNARKRIQSRRKRENIFCSNICLVAHRRRKEDTYGRIWERERKVNIRVDERMRGGIRRPVKTDVGYAVNNSCLYGSLRERGFPSKNRSGVNGMLKLYKMNEKGT
jgi:hypothetical protein